MQARDDYFLSGEARLRFRDEGQGMPVVFIHGWTVDLDVWNPQAGNLSDSMRVIRFDRRGFGLSQGSPSVASDTEDLRTLLDQLAIPRVSLVGASQGARVALAFATRLPERVAALVLDGPPEEVEAQDATGEGDFSVDAFRKLAQDGGADAFRRVWREHPLMKLHASDAKTHALLDAMLARYPARDLLGPEFTPSPSPSPSIGAASLEGFRKPVLIVNGEFDTRARLQAGERLRKSLPLAERILISNAGHLPNLDNPLVYDQAIGAFLQRQSRAAA